MDTNELELNVKYLAVLRAQKKRLDDQWKDLNKRIKGSKPYVELSTARKKWGNDIADLEADVRAGALDLFDGDNKRIIERDGKTVVGIQEKESYEYTFEKAMDWARENAPLAITEHLDAAYLESTFDQLAKSGRLPNFVTVKKTKSTTIATDLSPYLEDTDNG